MSIARNIRIAVACVAGMCVALGIVCSADAQARRPKRLALIGGMLLTGYDVPPIHHAVVLIEDNTIVSAGPASDTTIPPDTPVVDSSK